MKYPQITKELLDNLQRMIMIVHKQALCDHEFVKYGMGYKCNICDLYSGTREEWNKIIKEKKGY